MVPAAVLPARVRERLRWFSLTPCDQTTAEGRARERHRRVALTAVAAALAKLLSVATAESADAIEISTSRVAAVLR